MTRLIGLVQARMGSTRLPGKVMLPLAGKPLVEHIFERLRATPGVDGMVLATTVDPCNDSMVDHAISLGAAIWRQAGEDDIVGRLVGAARHTGADAILKVNADCPMVDPAILARIVAIYRDDPSLDYVSNKIVWTWPEGMSAEVIGIRSLEWCDKNLREQVDRELVANWIRDHVDRFSRFSVEADRDLFTGQPKLSVDTPEDFEIATHIFDALYASNPLFGFDDIVACVQTTSWRIF